MTVNQAIKYFLKVEEKRKEKLFTEETKCVGVARLGSPNPTIFYGTAKELLEKDFGEPLHSLIIPGKLHFVEEEALEQWE